MPKLFPLLTFLILHFFRPSADTHTVYINQLSYLHKRNWISCDLLKVIMLPCNLCYCKIKNYKTFNRLTQLSSTVRIYSSLYLRICAHIVNE